MNEKLQSVLTLYKKDQITNYVAEREIAQAMGENVSVKIVKDPKNIASTSFCVFALPKKLVQGYHITFIIDEDALRQIYSEEDFAVVVERLNAKKQAILTKYHKFEKETKKRDVSYNFALGFLLELYSLYRADLSVKDGEYLPDDSEMLKFAELFTSESGTQQDIEKLLLGEFVCPEIIEMVKGYVKTGDFRDDILDFKAETETPKFNGGQQEIKKYATSTFGIRNHKDIPYDYIPKTNQ